MGRKKDAFYAGFDAGETVDDVDQAWQDYKDSLKGKRRPKPEPVEPEDEDEDDDDDDDE